MASKREKKLKDIKMTESGQYEYTGAYYVIDESNAGSALSIRKQLVLLLAALIALVIVSGLSKAEAATQAFYVILPYAGEALSLFILGWGLVSILAAKDKIRESVIERSRGKIIGGATMLALFAVIGAICCFIYLAIHGAGDALSDTLLYIASKLLTASFAMRLRRVYTSIKWIEIE